MDKLTPEHVRSVRTEIEALPDDASSDEIEQAAERLETIGYQPMLIVEPQDFLRITKSRLLAFVDDLGQNAEEKNYTKQGLSLLVHHYKLLQRLRRDDPEAWDTVSELMEED